jgi:hypothetical protein
MSAPDGGEFDFIPALSLLKFFSLLTFIGLLVLLVVLAVACVLVSVAAVFDDDFPTKARPLFVLVPALLAAGALVAVWVAA